MSTPPQLTSQILIVDDQRPFQLMLKGILHGIGYRYIEFAQSGEQALNRCQQQSYQLIFIDYNLGSGKNGRQLLDDLHQMKLLQPDTICMLVTGENTVPMVLSAVELEPDDYLMKPFSLSVLRTRLQRLLQKKQDLADIYAPLLTEDWPEVVKAAQPLLTKYPRYDAYLRRLLVHSYIRLEQPVEAEQLMAHLLAERRPAWAVLLDAHIELGKQNYQRSIELCDEVLNQNRFLVEAYDLCSSCYQALQQPERAVDILRQALEISPYQNQRLQQMFQLSCDLSLWPDMIQSARVLYENTRKSGSNDPTHLLNYIRSLLTGVGCTDDASQRNRWQQETVLALHRARRDENLLRRVNFDLFDSLCQARLGSADGRSQEAHRQLIKLQELSEDDQAFHADVAFLMNQLGEYDGAQQREQQIDTNGNPALTKMLAAQQRKIGPYRQAFFQFSREAAEAYQQQDYLKAANLYEQAIQLAPLNTNTQLNLAQTLLQALNHAVKEQKNNLQFKLEQLLRQLLPTQLNEQQRQKLQLLREQFDANKHSQRKSVGR